MPVSRPVVRSMMAMNWGVSIVTAVALVIAFCTGWAQSPPNASEAHTRAFTQHLIHPVAVDFRLDHSSSTGNQVPTVWEAAQERKQERDGKDREVNPPYGYSIKVAHYVHERKSQFTQQRQASETPGVSLIILHHAWRGYLS